ncbi:hypothetical protein CH294_02440 [Rhodococcus sp. 14-2483-1-1]|nr:hypothetical protein CH294_02440 [Rhodococcus sp. 14-2483-1-1]
MSGADLAWPVYLLPAAGMLALSIGTIGQRILAPKEPIALSMAIQCSVSAAGFMTWSMLAGDAAPPMTVGFGLAVAWTVVLSTFGAYGAYLFVVRRSGPTRASVLLYLTPPTTMVWAWLMFGDAITWVGVGGLVVSAIGVAAYVSGTSTPATSPEWSLWNDRRAGHSPASAVSIVSSSANVTK